MTLPPAYGGGGSGGGGLQPGDITDVDFPSIDARDSYFSANMDKLKADMTIRVILATEIASIQQWTDEASPVTSYNSDFWKTNSVQVGASSFHISDGHTMSSIGENVVFKNEVSGINYFPVWQSRFFAPTGRRYTQRVDVQPGGDRDPVATTDFNVVFTVNVANTELSKILYVPGETYNGRVEYRITDIATSRVVFTDILYDQSLVEGVDFEQEFTAPLELAVGANVRAELVKNDGTYVSVRAELAFNDRPYTTSTISFYSDDLMQFEPRRRLLTTALLSGSPAEAIIQEGDIVEIDGLTTDMNLAVAPDVTHFSVRDRNESINPNDVIITLNGTASLTMDKANDFVIANLSSDDEWSYYNFRNGRGEII